MDGPTVNLLEAANLRKAMKTVVGEHGDLRDRLMFAADLCARNVQGDLAEIGAGRGGMTAKLAAVARKYSRRIIAIEPWEIGVEGCQEGDRDIFFGTTLPFEDIVEVWERSSVTVGTVKEIKPILLCFAYVNGQRTYPSMLTDLITVGHAGVIAIRMHGADFVVRLACDLLGKVAVYGEEEAYLI